MFAIYNVGIFSIVSIINRIHIFSSIQKLIYYCKEIDLYYLILITFASILLAIVIFDSKLYLNLSRWYIKALKKYGIKKELNSDTLDKLISSAGYSYEQKQDIFYSNMNPWQRNLGYCRLYDEAAAPLGMIIDCEPIYFQYNNKRWLIELWKGQYDLTTGCEIGVYTTKGPDLIIPGVFNGTFYHSASNEDLLKMSFTLIKNNKILCKRVAKHWWLTCFKLGEFSEPSELTMISSITLKDKIMRNEFVKGLMNAGYLEHEIIIIGNTVGLKFDIPRTSQPSTRTENTDWLIQRKNELLCNKYKEITNPYNNLVDKINAIKKYEPDIYKEVFNIGKTKHLFKNYKEIRKYLK